MQSAFLFLTSENLCMNCTSITRSSEVDFISGDLQTPDPLGPIIYLICESMQVEKIYLIGTHPAYLRALGLEYDLLILIHSADKRPMHEFESLIENRCHDLAMISVSVHKIEVVDQLIKKGNIFFSSLCHQENLLYDAGKVSLKEKAGMEYSPDCGYLREEFRKLFSKARSFYSGAAGYRKSADYQLAAFMLHQTVEHALNAFISPLIGYRLQTHNLNKLFLYARRVSTELIGIFPVNTDKEIQLYQTLHKAYIYGRYKNNFLVGEETILALIERAGILLDKTQAIFYRKVEEPRRGM